MRKLAVNNTLTWTVYSTCLLLCTYHPNDSLSHIACQWRWRNVSIAKQGMAMRLNAGFRRFGKQKQQL